LFRQTFSYFRRLHKKQKEYGKKDSIYKPALTQIAELLEGQPSPISIDSAEQNIKN
jgi:hypothetical protein